MAWLAVVAAVAAPVAALQFPAKDREFIPMLVMYPVAMAAVMPWLWRSSVQARSFGRLYIGMCGAALLGMPFALWPGDAMVPAGAATALGLAAAILWSEHRGSARVSTRERWIEKRGTRLRFDEIVDVRWDGLAIQTRGVTTSVAEESGLTVRDASGRQIHVDTVNHDVSMEELAVIRDGITADLSSRIAAAQDRGETFEAGPLRITKDQLAVRRPRPWTGQELLAVLGTFGAIPAVIAVQLLRQDGNPGGLLTLIPLGVVLLLLALDALRRRRPYVLDASTKATFADGDLVLQIGKKRRKIPLRFLSNATLVPEVLARMR